MIKRSEIRCSTERLVRDSGRERGGGGPIHPRAPTSLESPGTQGARS
jgi:hypothetical protein